MNKSYLIAFAVLVAAILWMLPALTGKNHKEADETTVAGKNAAAGTNVQAMRVDVLTVHAKKLAAHVVVNGQTQASRVVDLRARTDGKIAKLYFDRGARVQEGDVIAAMEVEDRQALLERARALLQQRKREHEVAAGLKKQGLGSQVTLETARANLEVAKADVKRAELELAYIKIKAPFDGVLETRMIEQGRISARATASRILLILIRSISPPMCRKGISAVLPLAAKPTWNCHRVKKRRARCFCRVDCEYRNAHLPR